MPLSADGAYVADASKCTSQQASLPAAISEQATQHSFEHTACAHCITQVCAPAQPQSTLQLALGTVLHICALQRFSSGPRCTRMHLQKRTAH